MRLCPGTIIHFQEIQYLLWNLFAVFCSSLTRGYPLPIVPFCVWRSIVSLLLSIRSLISSCGIVDRFERQHRTAQARIILRELCQIQNHLIRFHQKGTLIFVAAFIAFLPSFHNMNCFALPRNYVFGLLRAFIIPTMVPYSVELMAFCHP